MNLKLNIVMVGRVLTKMVFVYLFAFMLVHVRSQKRFNRKSGKLLNNTWLKKILRPLEQILRTIVN